MVRFGWPRETHWVSSPGYRLFSGDEKKARKVRSPLGTASWPDHLEAASQSQLRSAQLHSWSRIRSSSLKLPQLQSSHYFQSHIYPYGLKQNYHIKTTQCMSWTQVQSQITVLSTGYVIKGGRLQGQSFQLGQRPKKLASKGPADFFYVHSVMKSSRFQGD